MNTVTVEEYVHSYFDESKRVTADFENQAACELLAGFGVLK
jgi:hypothetical protein